MKHLRKFENFTDKISLLETILPDIKDIITGLEDHNIDYELTIGQYHKMSREKSSGSINNIPNNSTKYTYDYQSGKFCAVELKDSINIYIKANNPFTGLLFTIINSGWIFKGSRSQIDNKKNEFYTFLQIELLPAMNQGLGQTFESLQRNLLSFNGEFSRNLKKLSGIFDKNHETLSMQRELLELIDRSKVSEMTRYNVKVLQELNVATQQFERFNEYFANLNGYISNSYQITDKLTAILDRTDNFKKIADTLEDKLDQSQLLISFLTQHFQELDNHKQYVSNSVAEVAHGISDVFSELKEHIPSFKLQDLMYRTLWMILNDIQKTI